MTTDHRLTVLGLLLVIAGCAGSASTSAPPSDSSPTPSVVARYADTTLTLSEFETAYENANEQPTPETDSLAAYKEFLEQYVNYRLKVKAAREAGLDTLSSLQKEIRTYRREMARPRLLREQVFEPLTRKLYKRRKQEIDVSHILLRVPQDAASKDTLEAYRKMQQIADSLDRGIPFGDLAYRNSDAPAARKKGQRGFRGRLGFIRAGEIVEPFEDRMYTISPDSVSDVFRTRFGYHILKVHDRRPASPPIRLSHILVRDSSGSQSPRQLLDSLRTALLQNRIDFPTTARTYSQDRRSAANGGDLGEVESLRSLPSAFQTAVAQLDSVGAISPVVQTRFGYHLIKLTDRQERQSYEDSYSKLKKQISGRPRVEHLKTAFAHSVRSEVGITVDTAQILQQAPVATLDTLARPLLPVADADSMGHSVVATLGDSTFTLSQLAHHVMKTDGGAQLTVGEVLDDFLDQKTFAYEQARLETKDPEFAATMKEYREGLLAFQFMEDSVWTPATRDSSGLHQTYRQNRETYQFPERIRTIVLRAPADSLLSQYTESPENGGTRSSIMERVEQDSLITLDTMMVTKSSSEAYQPVWTVADGSTVGPLSQENESVLLIRDTLLPARRKTFEEARSSVIRDHQTRYKDEVMTRLRRTYNVQTYPERLRSAFE